MVLQMREEVIAKRNHSFLFVFSVSLGWPQRVVTEAGFDGCVQWSPGASLTREQTRYVLVLEACSSKVAVFASSPKTRFLGKSYDCFEAVRPQGCSRTCASSLSCSVGLKKIKCHAR
jgi:hypothetical protein